MKIINKLIYSAGVILSLIAFGVSSQFVRSCGDFSGRGFPFLLSGYCGGHPLFILINLAFWFSIIFIPIFIVTWAITHKAIRNLLISALVLTPIVIFVSSPLAWCNSSPIGVCLKLPLTYSDNFKNNQILEFNHGFPFPYLFYENWDSGKQLPQYRIVNQNFSWIFFVMDYFVFVFLTFFLLNRFRRNNSFPVNNP